MGIYANDLERIKAKYGTQIPIPAVKAAPSTDVHADTFVLEAESGRTILTAPARQVASTNEGFLYLHGRFVEADTPNRNGAYWTTADLEMGEPTVAGGPLNWLHQDRRIIGSLLNGRLVRPAVQSAAAGVVGNHIESTAAVWQFLFPQESATIEKASRDKDLFYSMECVSREVQCVGEAGCQEKFPYATYLREKAKVCEHLRESSSVRRFVDPVFLGAAIIVPPVQPGWAHANAEVVRQAAAVVEQEEDVDFHMSRDAAVLMVEQILTWANAA